MDLNKGNTNEDGNSDFPSFPNHVLNNENRENPTQGNSSNPYHQQQSQYPVPPMNYTTVQFHEDPARQVARMQGIKSLIFGALAFFVFYPFGLFIWPLMLAGIGFNIAGVVLGKKSSQGNYEGGAIGFWGNVVLLPLGIIATIIAGLIWMMVIISASTGTTGY